MTLENIEQDLRDLRTDLSSYLQKAHDLDVRQQHLARRLLNLSKVCTETFKNTDDHVQGSQRKRKTSHIPHIHTVTTGDHRACGLVGFHVRDVYHAVQDATGKTVDVPRIRDPVALHSARYLQTLSNDTEIALVFIPSNRNTGVDCKPVEWYYPANGWRYVMFFLRTVGAPQFWLMGHEQNGEIDTVVFDRHIHQTTIQQLLSQEQLQNQVNASQTTSKRRRMD